MSNISLNSVAKINSSRVTGLASGLDVDGMVQKMLLGQQSRIDKTKQQKSLLNWQKDAYRSVITTMNDFQSKFLDILSPTSLTKASNYKPTSVSAPSSMSQYFTASATSEAINSSVTVNKITQLATSQKIETLNTASISKPITMTVSENGLKNILGQSMSFSLNGETKNITLSNKLEDYYDSDGTLNIDKVTNDINAKLKQAFGSQQLSNGTTVAKISLKDIGPLVDASDPDYVNPNVIKNDDGEITGYKLELNIAPSNTVQVSGTNPVQSALGFSNNVTNYVNTAKTLDQIFVDENGQKNITSNTADNKIRFSINDVVFTFDRNTSMKDVMNEINKSSAGVTASYSSLSDKFTLTAKETGSGNNIRLSESVDIKNSDGTTVTANTNFLSLMFGQEAGTAAIGKVTEGQNAVLTVNNVEIVRNSNNVTIDGIALNLLQATPEYNADKVTPFNNTEAVSVKVNTDSVFDMIKNFVNEYNGLVNTLNGLVNEKRPKSGGDKGSYYMPLTDEQRTAMSEKDIENWEEMGKKGLLKNDPLIMRMVSSMRTAMSTMVETKSGNISLASIGIKPASYYEDTTGKLVIDEDKLRKAIEDNPEAVMNLFSQQSDIKKGTTMDDYFEKDESGRHYMMNDGVKKYMSESDLKNMRNNSMGLAQRISDIFYNNINVTLNEKERGSLILKVGTGGKNSIIDGESTFDKRLTAIEDTITKMQSKLYTAETKYYNKFAALETALAKLNSQSSYLGGLESGG